MADDTRTCARCGRELNSERRGNLCERCAPPSSRTGETTLAVEKPEGMPETIGGLSIVGVLGEGGMGTVYLARDPVLNREVALKVLKPDVFSPEYADRLSGEASLTGRLAHPGIVPVHQLGLDETWGPWYSMKLVQGRPLADVFESLRNRNARDEEDYPLPVLLGIFARVCDAIAFAHFNNVVHRDLKPGNIMLGEFGEVLVLDWGLARVLKPGRADAAKVPAAAAENTPTVAPSAFSRDGVVVGTPGYMAPEQAAGISSGITPASDVYALGAILYEIITLQPPVDTSDPDEAIRLTLQNRITPVEKRGAGRSAPRLLCQIVNRALRPDPNERFPTARELARAIDDFLAGRVPWREPSEARGAEGWDVVSGRWIRNGSDLRCLGGQSARVVHQSRLAGDVRLEFTLSADTDRISWDAGVWIALKSAFSLEGYQLRLAAGPEGRVELLRQGVSAVRRLDIRLASRARFHFLILREGDRLTVSINGTRALEYRDLFPLRGDCIALAADEEGLTFRDVRLLGRGAPLQLTFLALPDKLFQLGQVRESRDLYNEMAESHPDREEGLLARYKAALCGIELGDRMGALAALQRLEGTPLEALIPLGQARLEIKGGNPYEAVTALASGCQNYPRDPVRIELWSLLLDTIDGVERTAPERAASIYGELLRQTWLDPAETAQVCAESLRLAGALGGPARVRDEAMRVLSREKFGVEVRMECHAALARAGMTPDLVPKCRAELQETLALGLNLAARDRWLTMLRLSETQIAEGDLKAARETLVVVFGGAAHPSNEGAWARNWLALVALLENRPDEALATLERENAAYAGGKSVQELFRALLEAAALTQRGQSDAAVERLASAAAMVPEWHAVAGVLVGQEPLESMWAFAAGLSQNLAAELYLLAAEIFAARRQISRATQLRARAIQVSAGRALALWMVSKRGPR
jgi:serine/threonine protein kinase